MSGNKQQISDLLKQVKHEWGENKRLQVIGWAALVLLIVFMHSLLNDWRVAKSAEYSQQLIKLTDLKTLVGQTAWPQHAAASAQVWAEQKKRIWIASTEGEAQAKLRDWVQSQAQDVGLNVGRIKLEVAPAPKGLMWQPLQVDMQGVYAPGVLQRFLQRLSTAPGAILVEYEQITLGSSPFYRLNLTAWFELQQKVEVVGGGNP